MKQALVVLVCLTMLVWTVFAVPGQIKKNCCLNASDQPPHFKHLKSFEIQENNGRCNIKAVIFYTVKNKAFCSDPDSRRVKRLMNRLPVKH